MSFFSPSWLPVSIISVWAPREAASNETTNETGDFTKSTLGKAASAALATAEPWNYTDTCQEVENMTRYSSEKGEVSFMCEHQQC